MEIMEKFLTNLRKKPRAYRQSVALGISGGITAIIFLAWLGSFIVGANPIQNQDDNGAANQTATASSPFSVMKDQFHQLTADISNKFSGGGAIASSSVGDESTTTIATSTIDTTSTSNVSTSTDTVQ